jgi:hypothetical protein
LKEPTGVDARAVPFSVAMPVSWSTV